VTRRSARFILLLAALALAAAACTRLAYMNAALAYANAAPMLAWMVDDYVDLTPAQKDWVGARLQAAMAWHRSRELPRYARFLASVGERSRRPFTEAEVGEAWADVRADYARVVEHVLPDVAEFLAALDERQVAHLARKLADDNRRIAGESTRGTPEERRAKSAKRAIEHLEEWVGHLDERQRAIVAAREAALPSIVDERLADRRYRQGETLALARTHDRARIAAGLRRLLLEGDTWRRPDYQAKLRAREELTCRMIARLSATLTPEQRAHLQGRIHGYVRDITRLAAAA
jgi:uncharacterized protein DUF6279